MSSFITPQVSICLKKPFSKDKLGNILISPELTSSEYEGYIDLLISNLKQLNGEIKKTFSI
jgi:hypothetical protein|tara:strand:- start:210 stop:392 length:183 start_codon:yes stop_codon:yes gene_type:complete